METDSGKVTQPLKAMRAGDPQAARDLLLCKPARRSTSQSRQGRCNRVLKMLLHRTWKVAFAVTSSARCRVGLDSQLVIAVPKNDCTTERKSGFGAVTGDEIVDGVGIGPLRGDRTEAL